MNLISLHDISLSYYHNNECKNVFTSLNFSIKKNKFTTLLGKSGVGKSSLLKLIADFDKNMHISGQIKRPEKLNFAYLAQENTLFAHLNVLSNVLLKSYLQNAKEDQQKAMYFLELVGLKDKFKNPIHALSGGEKQRVCLARILMSEAELVLMDEPFCAIDEITKLSLYELFKKLLKDKTIFSITHCLSEALELSDEIYILTRNKITAFENFKNDLSSYHELINLLRRLDKS